MYGRPDLWGQSRFNILAEIDAKPVVLKDLLICTANPLLQNFKPSSIPVMRIELTYIANSWLNIDVGGCSKAVCIIAKLCQLFVKVNLLFQLKVKSHAQVQILTTIMFLAFLSNCGPKNKNCWRRKHFISFKIKTNS